MTFLITTASLCQTFSCLPQAGGLLDQDWFVVEGMQYVFEAQEEKRKLDEHKQKIRQKRGT